MMEAAPSVRTVRVAIAVARDRARTAAHAPVALGIVTPEDHVPNPEDGMRRQAPVESVAPVIAVLPTIRVIHATGRPSS